MHANTLKKGGENYNLPSLVQAIMSAAAPATLPLNFDAALLAKFYRSM
jgi:hypothetical protein